MRRGSSFTGPGGPTLAGAAGLWAVLALGAAGASEQEGRLIFSPLPMESTQTVVKQTQPLLHYLEQGLGLAIDIDYSTDYADIMRKFRDGTIDLAYLGPLPYVTLRRGYADAEPLVRFLDEDGADTYTCSLVTFPEPLPAADLTGKRIGLTQPLSTCGYLATSQLLRAAGVDIERTSYRYAGSHSAVALGVLRGDYDAGGLKTAIGAKYRHLGLTAVAESGPLPGFVLVSNGRTVSPALRDRIRARLIALHPLRDPADAQITAAWGNDIRHGAVRADDADFAGVRQALQGITIPSSGNF